ncbi:MAG: DegV family protein [Christensenellales bacterium]|jgi:DegV family protein with EDD domain
MAGFVIATDSSADMPHQFVEENELLTISLTYTYEGRDHVDDFGKGDGYRELYRSLRNGATSTTSQVNTDTFMQLFTLAAEQGKDILYVAFSSGLSGTCESGMLAAKLMKEKYPDVNIRVVDTLAASMGQGLLVYYAVEMKKQGKSMDEVGDWLENNKLRVNHWFTVDTLEHLKRGGRVSGTAAFVASMLEIKPVLRVDDHGKLVPVSKALGRKKSLRALAEKVSERIVDSEQQIIMISHGDCEEDAIRLRELVEKSVVCKGYMINFVGPVIGSHSGPGTLAVFFLSDSR